MVERVHHVEIICKNLRQRVQQFCQNFRFEIYGESCCESPKKIVLKREDIVFILTEGSADSVESVFNVALEIKDVQKAVRRVNVNHGEILQECIRHNCENEGYVDCAVIKTPVGDVIHSLFSLNSYTGFFLPGFKPCSNTTRSSYRDKKPEQSNVNLTNIDHITYALHEGTSHHVINWYNKCFGFTRFRINRTESDDDGFIVSTSTDKGETMGIRLTAMEYWRCAEVGLCLPLSGNRSGVKFVLAEPLPGKGPNQVRTFLSEHGGPGVQHIGLYSNDLVQTVASLRATGVEFIKPPKAYYSEIGKLDEIKKVGEIVDDLERNGILLDAELDDVVFETDDTEINHSELCSNGDYLKNRYLMQVFTCPMFDRDTFFMEIIQRFGATGFGSGNIKALWRAVDAYLYK